jgi:hypothetical protein
MVLLVVGGSFGDFLFVLEAVAVFLVVSSSGSFCGGFDDETVEVVVLMVMMVHLHQTHTKRQLTSSSQV